MSSESSSPPSARVSISARRGSSGRPTLSVAVISVGVVILLAVAGFLTYGFAGGFRTAPPQRVVCTPPSSPQCLGGASPHDVLLSPLVFAGPAGSPVPFLTAARAGETVRAYAYDFGDGSAPTVTNNTSVAHIYASPGLYLVSVRAEVGTVTHDNFASLAPVQVFPAANGSVNGTLPTVIGRVVANGTSPPTSGNATAVLEPGESVTLEARYVSPPPNPAWRTVPPRMVYGPGAQVLGSSATPLSASISLAFASPGAYPVTFEGGSAPALGGPGVGANYTWTVFVAPVGVHAALLGPRPVASSHPGTIIAYQLAPGGAQSFDPAIDYESAGEEAILNVYETLIAYNGSAVGATNTSFQPELATCVPGSLACAALYGSDLVRGSNVTFVIDSGARFFDPATNRSWPVYPSDVVFSVARTMGFANLPCVGCNNGWILAQSLAPPGNPGWDGGLHAPYNNTPQSVFGSMSVNDSRWCPALALSSDHGCVTFHATGGGRAWPFFLQLLANPLGASVIPCGWFSASAQAAPIPHWNVSVGPNRTGDAPCRLPGNATSTNDTAFASAVGATPSTAWDGWETLGSGATGRYLGNVDARMAGSGPYALQQYALGTSYTLEANPAYAANPRCHGPSCLPAPRSYAPRAVVTWEPSPSEGLQALAAGIADEASAPAGSWGQLWPLLSQGRAETRLSPTLATNFDPFDLNFDVRGAAQLAGVPASSLVPNDWFSYLGMRELFARAYPYGVAQTSVLAPLGIPAGRPLGGAIPSGLSDSPSGVPGPNGNPCRNPSNPVCPAYWYLQMLNASGPYSDPELAHCTPINPCVAPIFGPLASPLVSPALTLWSAAVAALTDGTIVAPVVIQPPGQIAGNSEFQTPGSNPMPLYALGWTPDYPDPTDYVQALYVANGTFPFGDALEQSLLVPSFSTGCPVPASNFSWYAARAVPVRQSCQGVAYQALQFALAAASGAAPGPARAQLYTEAERIANNLALYVYTFQANVLQAFAPWIDAGSVNTNPMVGGLGIWPFAEIAYQASASPGPG